ncbi:unnamed protein product [Ixodes persulcatus]
MSIHELYLLFAAPTTGQSISSYEVSRFTCRIFSYGKLDKCGKKTKTKQKTGIQTLVARGEAKLRALSNLTKDLPSFCCFRRLPNGSHGTQAGACAQTNAQQTLELAPVTDSPVIRQSLFAACIGYRLL